MSAPTHPRPELLLAATLYLLAENVAGGEDGDRARAVPDHLRRVANHPGIDPLVRETCAQLAHKLENRGGHDGRVEPGLVMPSNHVH